MTQRLAVEVTALAAQHIRRAEHWWRSNRPSVPNAVREDLEQALSLLATQPRIGPIARNVKLPGVRRVYLARISSTTSTTARSKGQTCFRCWHSGIRDEDRRLQSEELMPWSRDVFFFSR